MMGGGGPNPPPVPNPNDVAQNQQQFNLQSAITQQAMNQYNQVDPFGNTLGFSQIGTAPGGAPIYGVDQSLSSQNEALLRTLQQGQYAGGQAGMSLLNNAFPLYSGGLPNIGSAAGGATQAEMGLITNALQPNFEMTREQLDTQLRNQGIAPGTPAYQQQMNNLLQSQGQTYSGALAQIEPAAYSQALQNYLTPMQVGQSLLQMSQPSMPSYAGTPQTGITPTNLISSTANAQQAAEAAYQAQLQQQAAETLGISNIFGTALGGFLRSDRRSKTCVRRVGKLKNGLNIYSFRYTGDKKKHIGLMAQQVELIHPEAVRTINGIMHVNYELAMR